MLDVDRAVVTRGTDGSVAFDDPDAPWLARVWVDPTLGRVQRLQVELRPGCRGPALTATRLARLPVGHLSQVAMAEALGDAHPNETYYRMLARPKPPGTQHWGPEHWPVVLAVYAWAEATRRPGGGARAVADLWGVSQNPTAYRWLREARRREAP